MIDRVEKLKAMLEEKPGDAFRHYGLAMEYKKLGQHTQAIRVFDQLLELDPGYTATYLHLGMCLRAVDQDRRAEEVYRQGIEITQDKAQSHAREELEAALADLATSQRSES